MKIDIKGVIVPNDDKEVYNFFAIESVSPKDVTDALKQANGKPVDVYINSSGGDLFAGTEMYAALQEYKGEVNIHVVGKACSAASIILCAGKSDITPAGMVMIHNVSVVAGGDYHDMGAASEMLKQANDSVAAAYQLKTGKSRAEILKAMDNETWMSSAEAVRFGIVDGIAGPMRDQPQLAAASSPLMPKAMIEKARTLIPKGYNVSNPAEKPDFYMREKAQQQLNILKMEELNK